jgi:hypothetical protein
MKDIGEVIKQGLLLFSKGFPIPAVGIVSSIAAAVISKSIEVHKKRVSDALAQELSLQHVSYVQPDDSELLNFYKKNPIYPSLAKEFDKEIKAKDWKQLLKFYPYLYSALILKREIPEMLFHQEIEDGEFRKLAMDYEQLSRGYAVIQGKPELKRKVNRFAGQLLQVLEAAYDSAKDKLPGKKTSTVFEVIDLIREIAAS